MELRRITAFFLLLNLLNNVVLFPEFDKPEEVCFLQNIDLQEYEGILEVGQEVNCQEQDYADTLVELLLSNCFNLETEFPEEDPQDDFKGQRTQLRVGSAFVLYTVLAFILPQKNFQGSYFIPYSPAKFQDIRPGYYQHLFRFTPF